MPPLGGAGDGVLGGAVLGQDAGLAERLDQRQDPLVGDPSTHPLKERGVVDLIEGSPETLRASMT
jgi:hypothetical protein